MHVVFHLVVFAIAADRGARYEFYYAFRGRRIVYGAVVDIFSAGDALAGALEIGRAHV